MHGCHGVCVVERMMAEMGESGASRMRSVVLCGTRGREKDCSVEK